MGVLYRKFFRLIVFFALIFLNGQRLSAETKPLLLISIDGFHPSYLSEAKAPHLWHFAKEGVRAKSLKPIFPTLTFPNHYTLVTGLYSDKHGIVGNEIRDPKIPERFSLGAPREVVNDPRWWIGEPIWVTAQKQGLRSGTMFWPGSEAPIQNIRPTYFEKYEQSLSNPDRVKKLLEWMDLSAEKRPHFYTLYFDTVDTAGHRYGPRSAEVAAAVKEVDDTLGLLFEALQTRGTINDTNILIVSDHGMLSIEEEKEIDISDVLSDFPQVERIAGGAVAGFFSANAKEIYQLEKALREKSKLYKVYRKKYIPSRYRYQKSDRIPDLLLVAEAGAYIRMKRSFAPSRAGNAATHGYDNALESMQAIFLARGPSFPEGQLVEAFDNVNLYALMCKLLGIKASPNDGSLKRIPKVLARTSK